MICSIFLEARIAVFYLNCRFIVLIFFLFSERKVQPQITVYNLFRCSKFGVFLISERCINEAVHMCHRSFSVSCISSRVYKLI